MVDFSFVIVTYHSHLLVGDAIKSIQAFESNHSAWEIIIVDNSDEVGHQLLLRTLHEENLINEVRLLRNHANTGYGAGNNMGISHATGTFIAVMNPDVRLTESLTEHTRKLFGADQKMMMVGYRQMGGQNVSFYRKPEHMFPFSGWYLILKNRLNLFNQRKDFLSGAFFFADKEKFMRAGMFDENIFLYNEESDLSARINRLGLRIRFVNTKSYVHLLDQRPFNPGAFRLDMKSLKYYLRKYRFKERRIISANLLEYGIKKKLAALLGKKAALEKFSQMSQIMREEFEERRNGAV